MRGGGGGGGRGAVAAVWRGGGGDSPARDSLWALRAPSRARHRPVRIGPLSTDAWLPCAFAAQGRLTKADIAMTDIGPNFRGDPGRAAPSSGDAAPSANTAEALKLPADAVVIVPVRN